MPVINSRLICDVFMDETYLTEAIILNRQPFKEDDLQITVYSRERGRLFLVARGGRKAKSKLAAHLEPLCRTEIMVVRGRHYDYAGSAVSVDCYGKLKSDYEKVSAANMAVKKIIQTVKEGMPDKNIFEIISALLNELNEGILNPKLAAAFFSLQLLARQGLAPELNYCVLHRGKITPNGNRFDFVRSGLVCPQCRAAAGNFPAMTQSNLQISDDCIKIMRLVLSEDFNRLKKIKCSAKLEAEIISLVDKYYQYATS